MSRKLIERLFGRKYGESQDYRRVPSHGTISASTTSASLAADFEQHLKQLAAYGRTPKEALREEDTDSSDDVEDFEKARLCFQSERQPSILGVKMEMEVRGGNKSDNLRTAVPFVKQLSSDMVKGSINGDQPYKSTTQKINYTAQLIAAISVSLGSFVVGFTTGYTSPALSSMKSNTSTIEVTEAQGSWIGGMMPLVALLGGIIGGLMIVRLGRRNTILAIAIPFITSYILIASSTSVYQIYVGRALGGLCVGIGSLAFPVYLGEVLQPEVRGQLGLFPTALGNIGILVCYTAGMYMDWSMLAYLGAIIPLPYLVLTFMIPETPRWYISRGNHKAARASLEWLRGKECDVDSELKEIVKSQEEAEREKSSILDLFKSENVGIVLILLFLMFCQQLSGINAVMFYSVSIFESAGSSVDTNICSIIIGVVNFVATFVATVLIDRLGRKILLYISSVAMILTLATLGSFFLMKHLEYDVQDYGFVPLVSLVVYVVGFSIGFGPIPWLMMGEILPSKVRGSAASLATSFNWLCTFVVTKTFDDTTRTIGEYGTFWMYGIVCIIGLFFTIFKVPETKGKSLEDIEKLIKGNRK